MPSSKTETINCKTTLSDKQLVPDDQIKLFCQILQDNRVGEVVRHADGSYHVRRERPKISKLNFPLSRPDPITRKFLLPKQSEYTYLCDEHEPLNADFVHQWFKYLQLEVGARLEILRASTREHIGGYSWDNVVKPLTRLHRLWMKDTEVKLTFGKFCHKGFENTIDMIDAIYQEDGCEACVLKRVGSHINTLHALRCIVKSRLSLESHAKHPKRLRLLRLIEPWIELLENKYAATEINDQREIQQSWVTGLSEELYEKRKELELDRHRRRRAQRHLLEVYHSNSQKYKQYVQDLEGSAVDGNAHDAENDIIDSYAALRAAQRVSVIASVDIIAGNILECPSYQIQAATPRSEDIPSTPSETTTAWSEDSRPNSEIYSPRQEPLSPDNMIFVIPQQPSGQSTRVAEPFSFDLLSPVQEEQFPTELRLSAEVRAERISQNNLGARLPGRRTLHGIMPNDEFRRHYRTSQVSESDSYYVQDRHRPLSRDSGVSAQIGNANRGNRRSDTSSTRSGYSEYYRRNRK